ncbi:MULTISPECIES: class I SAM-dependent methyltransferase [Metallosphaera]|uniref:Methyltransferase type 11 n=3 Tax=Metallosphaera TaxID=41980 RepID=A4YF80_METS5|nr:MULTISPECIES: class I SAM-dependent methyltransferase [Metallosphaera]ABP95082.1 Methyltransferase type 11 [Metallosphaera sedula DSM 5348]AIM27068.1 Methyltransferase type 11 [Metallosphaera sedula]AKV73983.1 methyltransferase type 11 [Metallosphaera sedula]AKV76222.1 methyltransferase type 11 [Metallosphaera sedula]AKV78475.1 methyltransferase type 11 [Metallosphaera sedula]
MSSFDKFSEKYDTWFLNNRNVLMSELLLVEKMLRGERKILSVGCGSGLFESLLRERGIMIEDCVEPSEMGKIAEARGLRVKRGYAEELPVHEKYDAVLMNGVIHYLRDPAKALLEANRVLREGGHLILCWVAGEGSYGLLYRLASLVGWKELEGVSPKSPYPLEFVREAKWQTVGEVRSLLRNAGFEEVLIMQTLTRHPKYSNDEAEDPSQGYDRGDYVCIKARKT